MSIFDNIIREGKIYKVDLKKERYINYFVMFGFGLLLTWMLFLFPNVFVDIKFVLMLLFIPPLLLTPLLYKKLLSVSGYKFSIKNNFRYNFTMGFLAYMLVTIPIGNFIVTSFLFSNYLFAQVETKTIIVEPFDIRESYSRQNKRADIFSRKYSHFEVGYDGIEKRINFGETSLDSIANKSLSIKVSKGLFGYYVIRAATLTTKQSW